MGQGGDPDIDPFRANQADVSFEWYHGDDEIVSAALFYKDIESFITDRPVQQAHLRSGPATGRRERGRLRGASGLGTAEPTVRT